MMKRCEGLPELVGMLLAAHTRQVDDLLPLEQ